MTIWARSTSQETSHRQQVLKHASGCVADRHLFLLLHTGGSTCGWHGWYASLLPAASARITGSGRGRRVLPQEVVDSKVHRLGGYNMVSYEPHGPAMLAATVVAISDFQPRVVGFAGRELSLQILVTLVGHNQRDEQL